MKKIVIHPTYFPGILAMSKMIFTDKLVFEVNDFYEKQTYRTRMHILSPNGKQSLSVPVKHTKSDGKQYYKDVRISYDFDWQKLHWRSLETAYRTSPYFEFYEDDIKPLFFQKEEKLVDYNIKLIQSLWDLLEIEKDFDLTTEYKKEYPSFCDLRNLKEAKKDPVITNKFPAYTQVFSNKFPFIPNLSFLDLLFMEGPNSLDYLEQIHKITESEF